MARTSGYGKALVAGSRSDLRVMAARHGLAAILFVAGAFGVLARIAYARDLPLWFDETFTGTIAIQPTGAALLRWCLSELSGPGFYMPVWLWANVAGASDQALRLPGLAMAIAAPLFLAWRGHPDRSLRWLWAILAFLSTPMIVVANEARPYPQLFLLGCLQAVLFLSLFRTPTSRALLGWASVTALLVLSHYHAAMIGLAQGVILLAALRHWAVRHWFGFLPFLLPAVWIAFHLHFLMTFSAAFTTSFGPQPWQVMAIAPLQLLGAGPIYGIAILAILAYSAIARPASHDNEFAYSPAQADRLLIWAGCAALALAIGIGFVRPGFSTRYLTPTLPALLFGLAVWARTTFGSRPHLVAAAAVALLLGVTSTLASATIDTQFVARQNLSFEAASDWLMEERPHRLVFFWQSRVQPASAGENLAEVAAFFFHRSGMPIQVAVARPSASDPNGAIDGLAHQVGAKAILWIRDANSGTGAGPSIEQLGSAWTCRDFGFQQTVIFACRAKPARPALTPRVPPAR